MSSAEVEAAANAGGATDWRYGRSVAGGDLEEIRNAADGRARWALLALRGPGHQIVRDESFGSARSLTHDAAGSVLADGPYEYVYDPRGRLAAVRRGGALVEAYAADAANRLAAVFRGAATQPAQLFAHDGPTMAAAVDVRGGFAWEAAWGPALDQIVELRDRSGPVIPLVDERLSVVAAWRPGAGLVQSADYTPEGALTVLSEDGSVACDERSTATPCVGPAGFPFSFVSAWRSERTGLTLMRNRWYSARHAEFIALDPLFQADGGSGNRYAYAAEDPVNGWDPFGLDPKSLAELVPARGVQPPPAVSQAAQKGWFSRLVDKIVGERRPIAGGAKDRSWREIDPALLTMGESYQSGAAGAALGAILANWIFGDIKPDAGDWAALGGSFAGARGRGPGRGAGQQPWSQAVAPSGRPGAGGAAPGGAGPTGGGGSSSGMPKYVRDGIVNEEMAKYSVRNSAVAGPEHLLTNKSTITDSSGRTVYADPQNRTGARVPDVFIRGEQGAVGTVEVKLPRAGPIDPKLYLEQSARAAAQMGKESRIMSGGPRYGGPAENMSRVDPGEGIGLATGYWNWNPPKDWQ